MSSPENHTNDHQKRKKTSCHQSVADFANIVKAFIGTNYLGLPYAFLQSGLVLGSVTLVVIASLTDHCCQLVVKCKYRLIDEICHKKLGGDAYLQKECNEELLEEVTELRKRLQKNMDYGDVARLTMGKWGPLIVNICLTITQCGFCIGYFIFIGNTIYQLFPVVEVQNATVPKMPQKTVMGHTIVHAQNSGIMRRRLLEYDPNIDSNFTDLSSSIYTESENFTEATTQSIPTTHFSTTIESTTSHILSTSKVSTTNASTAESSTLVPSTSPFFNLSTTLSPTNRTEPDKNRTIIYMSTAPPLQLLVLVPLPLFILFTYFRSVRRLGSISILANIAIFVGYFLILYFLVSGLQISSDVEIWATLTSYPIFFGLVSGAYEGIGTVIPIESSMEGNQHRFPSFLHGGIGMISVVLASFGILGYMKLGAHTPQIITQALHPNSYISFIVNITLLFAVTFTYPLQIFPVTEIMEGYIFADGKCCGPKKHRLHVDVGDSDVSSVENDPLLSDDEDTHLPIADAISNSVSTWKRNLFRTFIPCILAGIAVVFRNSFAYVSAFTAALGSTMLAYVLPCAFHIALIRHEGHKFLIVKDVCIIIFGVCAGLISEAVTIMELVRRT